MKLAISVLVVVVVVGQSEAQQLNFEKIMALLTGGGDGGSRNAVGRLFKSFETLFRSDPPSAFTAIFQNKVFDEFLSQTGGMKKQLYNMQKQMRSLNEQLKRLQGIATSGRTPEDIVGELEGFNFDSLIGRAERNSKRTGDFRSQFSRFTNGLANLQKAFKDPESLKRGLSSILSQRGGGDDDEDTDTYYYGETDEPSDRKTKKGQSMVEKLIGLVSGGDGGSTVNKLKDLMKLFPSGMSDKGKGRKKGKKTKRKSRRSG